MELEVGPLSAGRVSQAQDGVCRRDLAVLGSVVVAMSSTIAGRNEDSRAKFVWRSVEMD